VPPEPAMLEPSTQVHAPVTIEGELVGFAEDERLHRPLDGGVVTTLGVGAPPEDEVLLAPPEEYPVVEDFELFGTALERNPAESTESEPQPASASIGATNRKLRAAAPSIVAGEAVRRLVSGTCLTSAPGAQSQHANILGLGNGGVQRSRKG
jgi:hypothetical protein